MTFAADPSGRSCALEAIALKDKLHGQFAGQETGVDHKVEVADEGHLPAERGQLRPTDAESAAILREVG